MTIFHNISHFRFDENKFLIDLNKKTWGAIVTMLVIALMLYLLNGITIGATVAVVLISCYFFPTNIFLITGVTTLAFTLSVSATDGWGRYSGVFAQAHLAAAHLTDFHIIILKVTVLILAIFFLRYAKKFPKLYIYQHPIITLHATIILMLFLSHLLKFGTLAIVIAFFAAALTKIIWFLGYAVRQVPNSSLSPWLHVINFCPFWNGPSNVPAPKGIRSLETSLPQTKSEFATRRLHGLQLLTWAFFLYFFIQVPTSFVTKGSLAPMLPEKLSFFFAISEKTSLIIDFAKNPSTISRYTAWASIIAHFIEYLLKISISGHLAIATVRILGFKALRNTYRPLESKSISDFYNRIFYYFKEVLVDFFFYPTFLRLFKSQPRLRIFAATFAAAGVGNFIFHVMRDCVWQMQYQGIMQGIYYYRVYAVYCLILGATIGLSQILPNKKTESSRLYRGANLARILIFYCLIMVLDDPAPNVSLTVYIKFYAFLFGL